MSALENEQVVRAAFEAWASGDVAEFFALVDEDVRWTITGACPVSGQHAGKREFFERAVAPVFAKLKTAIRPSLRALGAFDDRVILQWDGEATRHDETRYFNEFCWVFRMADRKIVECTAYFCTARAAELLSSGVGT